MRGTHGKTLWLVAGIKAGVAVWIKPEILGRNYKGNLTKRQFDTTTPLNVGPNGP
jgi:hypothetical protein